MITLSIDISKIDKTRFKTAKGRDGSEKKYLELVLFETDGSDYGDYIVKQATSREEREGGVQLPILGNGKKWERGSGAQHRRNGPAPVASAKPSPAGDEDDSVPF